MYEKSGNTELEAKTWCNTSLVHLQLNELDSSLKCARKALELYPTYCKVSSGTCYCNRFDRYVNFSQAYYRRAQAYEKLENYEHCVNDYTTSYELEPQRKTFYQAVKLAVTHGMRKNMHIITFCGILFF